MRGVFEGCFCKGDLRRRFDVIDLYCVVLFYEYFGSGFFIDCSCLRSCCRGGRGSVSVFGR